MFFVSDNSTSGNIKDGKMSVKNLRSLLDRNINNNDVVLSCESLDLVFNSNIDFIMKLIEQHFLFVNGLIDYTINNEMFKPESLDSLHKVTSSQSVTYLRIRNLCIMFESEQKKIPIKNNHININEYLGEFESSIHETLPIFMSRNIKVKNYIKKPVYVSAWASEVTHILINLLSNALIHSHNEENKVDVISNNLEKEGYIAISVIDYGVGVDLEKLHMIMNRNVKEYYDNKSSFKKYKGCGLAVCQKLAKNMDGKILVFNSDNCGAVFTLLIKTKELKIAPQLSDGKKSCSLIDKPIFNLMIAEFRNSVFKELHEN